MKRTEFWLKLASTFVLSTFIFFILTYFQIITPTTLIDAQAFIASEANIRLRESSTLEDSLAKQYLQNLQGTQLMNQFSEETIDPAGFYLRIDAIDLFKAIVIDVDPRYKEIYQASWEKGVSHGKFTAYPDQIGITYLYAHAISNQNRIAEENAWFSYMDQLTTGDEIIIYYNGKKYTYEVSEIHVVNPDATGFYTGTAPVQMVRMQFCGPPTGSLAKRTLVDALLLEVSDL